MATQERRGCGALVTALALLLALPLGAAQAAVAAEARPATSAATRSAQAAAAQLKTLAGRAVRDARVPGLAYAVVHDGVLLEAGGLGLTEVAVGEPVDADTVFRIASLSKTFAGTLAALLVREGALRWDSRIADQLPAFKLADIHAAERLTVRDILSHRVGLPWHTFDRDLEADEPYPLLVAKLEQAPSTCAPGDCYGYQNIAFSLIGDMVFATTGGFYSYQVERRLFHPLGMYGATFGRDALEASPRWARPHVRRGGQWLPVRPKETYYRVPPAAGVNASANDLARWLAAQMGARPDVLPTDLLQDLHAPQIATPGEIRGRGWRRARLRDAHYATGWRVYDYAGETLLFHAGAVQGYRASMAMLRDRRFGVVLLWNCESAVPSGLLPATLDRFLGLADRDWTGLVRPGKRRSRH